MTTDALRKSLADARRLELLTGCFELSLQESTRRLHRAIQLPSQGRGSALVDFVTRYIEQTAALIDDLERRACGRDMRDGVAPAIAMALSFFSPSPRDDLTDGLTRASGLRLLMERAYLAQRLLEEICDRLAPWRNSPLLAVDSTRINLIIHQLIGEPRANRLDVAASRVAAELLPSIRLLPDSAEMPPPDNLRRLPLARPAAGIRLDLRVPGDRNT